jgi:amino acid transporter
MARDGLLPELFNKHNHKGVLTWNLLATGAVLTRTSPFACPQSCFVSTPSQGEHFAHLMCHPLT